MAIARALPGFNDLGRSVTPIFLLMDHFLYRFSTFSEKMKKIYRLEVWIFAKCTIEFRFLALRLSVRRFQMPLEGLSFVKTLVKFGIIYATDPLLQNMTKSVYLHWLAFDIFSYKPLYNITKAKRALWLVNLASTICPWVYAADVCTNVYKANLLTDIFSKVMADVLLPEMRNCLHSCLKMKLYNNNNNKNNL